MTPIFGYIMLRVISGIWKYRADYFRAKLRWPWNSVWWLPCSVSIFLVPSLISFVPVQGFLNIHTSPTFVDSKIYDSILLPRHLFQYQIPCFTSPPCSFQPPFTTLPLFYHTISFILPHPPFFTPAPMFYRHLPISIPISNVPPHHPCSTPTSLVQLTPTWPCLCECLGASIYYCVSYFVTLPSQG